MLLKNRLVKDLRAMIRRLLHLFGFNHILILFTIIPIVLISLLLAGCTYSSTMADIFLISFSYTRTTSKYQQPQFNPNISSTFASIAGDAQLEVRVGYFGLCIRQMNESWLCSNNAAFASLSGKNESLDPLNLIWMASQFKNNVAFSGLEFIAIGFAAISIIILISFNTWNNESDDSSSELYRQPFPSARKMKVTWILLLLSSMCAFATALWQHVASEAVASSTRDFGYGSIESGLGLNAIVLGWTGFGTLAIAALCMWLMMESTNVLTDLMED